MHSGRCALFGGAARQGADSGQTCGRLMVRVIMNPISFICAQIHTLGEPFGHKIIFCCSSLTTLLEKKALQGFFSKDSCSIYLWLCIYIHLHGFFAQWNGSSDWWGMCCIWTSAKGLKPCYSERTFSLLYRTIIKTFLYRTIYNTFSINLKEPFHHAEKKRV